MRKIIETRGSFASDEAATKLLRLSEAEGRLLASLARGLNADKHAVLAALREPRSNGQTEGRINKLKALKRQMYGRANLDLLRARLVAAAGNQATARTQTGAGTGP